VRIRWRMLNWARVGYNARIGVRLHCEATVSRSEIYLRSIGAATLVLELRDSQTNAILARSIDRRAIEQQGTIREVTSVTTISEVKRLMRF
jgi:hypothetical protein